MTAVRGLAEAVRRLQRVDLGPARQQALADAATRLEAAVRQTLSHFPGEDHGAPWLRTGGLRDSITHKVEDGAAVVGSTKPVAVFQELGTSAIPPRPFLSSTAASASVDLVSDIAHAIHVALGNSQ